MSTLVNYFTEHHKKGHSPLLLEYPDAQICGINPMITLEVRDGKLYKNKKHIGEALEIFHHLEIVPDDARNSFFPAWLGFFSYSFARYFDFLAHKNRHFPDAFFQYFIDGIVIQGNDNTCSPNYDGQHVRHLFKPDVDASDFKTSVAKTKECIRNGDVYQGR